MEALALAGGVLYLAVLGFWIMGRLGRFLDEGGILPDWDEGGQRDAPQAHGEAAPENRTPANGRADSAIKK